MREQRLAQRGRFGDRVVGDSKRSEEGLAARAALIRQFLGVEVGGMEIQRSSAVDAATDDLHDALALLWTAARISSGDAERIPEVVDFDPVGLDMAMWF